MALVTLIGEKIAKKGLEFTYIGPQNDCKNCKLKTVCFNLKKGRKYKIKKVRNKKHNCNVHEKKVSVIEVEELPIITTIDKKISKGASINIENKECDNIGCEYYPICNINIQKDKKYTVKDIIDDVDCPIGYSLNKVELKD